MTNPEPQESVAHHESAAAPAADFSRQDLFIAFALLLLTFAAYWRVAHFDFVGLDDYSYVAQNPHLPDGFSVPNLKWILFSYDPDNWFPLTRFSFVADYQLFGLNAAAYHIENVVIHGLAALLLFGFLRRATGVRWLCAFVAAVFALHPLHVESVAWVAERKDVLCALFWFATLWAWLRYTERPSAVRYIDALVLFCLGAMSKPMIVTLPLLLFLLDIWPFRRLFSRKLVAEKVPFIAISSALTAFTFLAQQRAYATQSFGRFPPMLRLKNALVSVAIYLTDTLWPSHEWIPYAYPRDWPAWQVLAAAAAIAIISATVLSQIRRRPWLAVGWFWFLLTLLPVIGFAQVGLQARADRYMYVPMVGLSIALAWGVAEMVRSRPALQKAAAIGATAACISMALLTSVQTGYWKETELLYMHAIDMDHGNYLAWNELATTLASATGLSDDVISYIRSAIRLRPDLAFPHINLAVLLCENGRRDEGMREYREALRIESCNVYAHYGIAQELNRMSQWKEAIGELQAAIGCDPRMAAAQDGLGVLLIEHGRSAEGLSHLEKAVELDPYFVRARCNLGLALIDTPGRLAESIPQFRKALELDPRSAAAHIGLAKVLIRFPTLRADAIANLEAAQRLEPNPERRRILERMEAGAAVSPK